MTIWQIIIVILFFLILLLMLLGVLRTANALGEVNERLGVIYKILNERQK